MKHLVQIIVVVICSSCSLIHHQDNFEMERLSEDVLGQKGSSGISIEITKIPLKP